MSMNPEFRRFRECQYCKELIPINEYNEDLVNHDCQISEAENREMEQLGIQENREASEEQEILEKAKDLKDRKDYQTLLQKFTIELIKQDIEAYGRPKVSMSEYQKIAEKEIRKQSLREVTKKIAHPELELYIRTLQSFLKDYDDKLGGILDKNNVPHFSCPVVPCRFLSKDSAETWAHFLKEHPLESQKYVRADLLLREGKFDAYKYYRKYPKAEGYYPPMFKISPRGVCPQNYHKVQIKGIYHCVEKGYYAKKGEKLSQMDEEESKKYSNNMIILTALTRNKKEVE